MIFVCTLHCVLAEIKLTGLFGSSGDEGSRSTPETILHWGVSGVPADQIRHLKSLVRFVGDAPN